MYQTSELCIEVTTYLVGSNMLRSMIHCVGKGIAIGVVIACCTPTTGGGTPGTDRPAKQQQQQKCVNVRVTTNLIFNGYFQTWKLGFL